MSGRSSSRTVLVSESDEDHLIDQGIIDEGDDVSIISIAFLEVGNFFLCIFTVGPRNIGRGAFTRRRRGGRGERKSIVETIASGLVRDPRPFYYFFMFFKNNSTVLLTVRFFKGTDNFSEAEGLT